MTSLLVSSTLIIGFAVLTYFFNKITHWKICFVCAGVSLTWLTLSFLILSGLVPAADYLMLAALLLGGTVVGIVYQGEKKFKVMRSFTPKMVVLIIGFALAYLLLANMSWLTLIAATLTLIPLGYLFFLRLPQATTDLGSSEAAKELEDKMKDCC